MSKKNEVAVKEQTAVALSEVPEGAWGSEGVKAEDIIIPRILLQQPLSDAVVNDKARPGDMMDSMTEQVLGGKGKPIEIIPIMMYKTVRHEKLVSGSYKFSSIENVSDFPTDALEYDLNGEHYKKVRCLNFYVLVAKTAANADAFPMLLTFKSTSLMSGKALATHFSKAMRGKYPPAAKVFSIESEMKTNDKKQNYYVFSGVKEVGNSTPEQLKNAYDWYKIIKSGSAKVDDKDDSSEEAVGPAPDSSSDIPF